MQGAILAQCLITVLKVRPLNNKRKEERVERVKNFSDFAEQNLDGGAGKFFTALTSTDILIALKRNPSISGHLKRR